MTPSNQSRLSALSLAALAALTLTTACSDTGPRQFLSLGTASTGGIYYPLGGAMAARLSVSDPARQYTAEVSGGSVENVNRLRGRQTDLAFATGNTVYEAFSGGQDYPEAVADLRILAPLYPNMTHIVVRRGSTATSLADLAGGIVSVGPPGSGTEQMSRQILEAYGLTYEDVTERFLSFPESATALKDGAIDAAIISVGYPAAAVLEATTTGGARLIAMEPARVDALRAKYPYYTHGEIPAGIYPGADEALHTAGVMNWVVAMADLPDEVVAGVLRLLTDERADLAQVHDMVNQIHMEALGAAPIALHGVTQAWVEANLPGGS